MACIDNYHDLKQTEIDGRILDQTRLIEPQDVPNLAKRLLLSHKYGYLKFTSSGKFISCNSCSDVAQYVFKNMRLFQRCHPVHGLTSHRFHPTISINLKMFNNLWLPDECTLC